jgi:hypothetical protein
MHRGSGWAWQVSWVAIIGVHTAKSVISSQEAYMIGEFCPKVFALRWHDTFGLGTIVFHLSADASAGVVNMLETSP